MIKTRKDLKEAWAIERNGYNFDGCSPIIHWLLRTPNFYIGSWQKNLRKAEYYFNRKGLLSKALALFYRRRENVLGSRLGIEIYENSVDIGLQIRHGNVVINGKAKIGKNALFYGQNCIGAKKEKGGAATIGDNVTFGVGSSVLGEVTIADNCVIAAGAVVVDSFLEEGSVIAGVPAKKIK